MKNYIDESTLDSLMEGFQVIDFDWRYVYVNETVAKQGKSSKHEMLGKTMMEKYPGIDQTPMFDILSRCMKERIPANIENEFNYPDGSKGWFELRIEPVPEGLFILSADISERKKAETELLKLNESLENLVAARTEQLNIKNKDLTDSIEYAKRIQQSMLPASEEIAMTFPQSFVLFKPKDIVSGDFYFFHKSPSSVYMACADCTGHGVPGALMSMIGFEKLEKAVTQSSDPSWILSYLNREIKKSLRQIDTKDAIRDGMDIAFCSLFRSLSMAGAESIAAINLQYAAANRPLWIIRNKQNAIEEIKATRKSIGGHTPNDQQFNTHNIRLFEGDTFYIFSDGYSDSFGGKSGKKLMIRKFKELLLSIQHLNMPDQEKHLDTFIENWRGSSEQVDDILVMGVRI